MSFSDKEVPTIDRKLSSAKKLASLNPNAAEFVPVALRSSPGSSSTAAAATSLAISGTGTFVQTVLDQSESSISIHSDEESHQYWCRQLPDDITPDYKVMEEDGSQGINSISFSNLALHDSHENSRVSASRGSGFLLKECHELSPRGIKGDTFSENIRYSVPSYGEDAVSANFLLSPTKHWDKPMLNSDRFFQLAREGYPYNGNSIQGLLNEQSLADNTEMNPLEFLSSLFPGFAAESLAEVYFANGGDLNLTVEMLMQLELRVDGGLYQNLSPKALSAPNLTAMDIPALTVQGGRNHFSKYGEDDNQHGTSSYQPSSKELLLFKNSSTVPALGAVDFASAVRKMSPQDSGVWKFERKGSADASVGSSRSAHVLASSYNGGHGRGIYGERVQSRTSSRAAPAWLDTGEAVANMYSDMREEARDHARLHNAYFEQARQAYLVGNKALAKELSVKGQLYNIHMKAAHGKAQESIFHQRNPVGLEMQGNGIGQERIIDLHGLHVTEAVRVLKRELALLRNAARSAERRLQVYICVGTGHHPRGSRTPSRLPIAVQRYLLEEESLDYTEPQPGLLRVLVY